MFFRAYMSSCIVALLVCASYIVQPWGLPLFFIATWFMWVLMETYAD